MTLKELLDESYQLERVAGSIQSGTQVGLSEESIQDFVNTYLRWYAEGIAALSDESSEDFRSAYQGSWLSPRIKNFLEAPTAPNSLYSPQQANLFPYWQNPYQTSFRAPLLEQRRVLQEALARRARDRSPFESSDAIERIVHRFHEVACQLGRRHNNRESIEVNDEYDMQDLLHALLKLWFDDIRAEEWSPSYAGASSRIDFLLKTEKIVVEVKKTRANLGAKEIGEQLIVDIARYRSHPDCDTLVAFIYDPERRLSNPAGLENDLSGLADQMQVKVFVKQS